MQAQSLRWKRGGVRVALVPTMGYLHRGHLSLVTAARKRVGATGRVVLSLFVNPTQFGPGEDFERYPRDEVRDLKLCRESGVDVVFIPQPGDMYLTGPLAHSTRVEEEVVSLRMEGGSRPTHFQGVTTVVAKLFNLVLPDVAIFGAKDYQQSVVIARMARDLNFPVRVVVAPTVREPDGLALSSRNVYLSPAQRAQAPVLSRLLSGARRRVAAGPVAARELEGWVRSELARCPEARLDYVAFVDAASLEPQAMVRRSHRMALAVFLGRTRLIDNARL